MHQSATRSQNKDMNMNKDLQRVNGSWESRDQPLTLAGHESQSAGGPLYLTMGVRQLLGRWI